MNYSIEGKGYQLQMAHSSAIYNQQMAQRSAIHNQQQIQRGIQAKPKPPPPKENLPLGFPNAYHPDYAQKLGEWNVQHGRAPTDTPPHISKPPMYAYQKPYEDPKVKKQREELQRANSQISKLSSNVESVQASKKELEEDVSSLKAKTQETLEAQRLHAEQMNALAAGQSSNNSTITNVAAKVGEQEEIQNRLAAQLSEKTAALRLLEEKMETQQIKNRELTEASSHNEEKLGALIGQNREALAKAEEEKQRREELEQQMLAMSNGFLEMKMLMEATKAELKEVKRQANEQQIAQARQEAVHASIDLKLRRNSREFPPSRTITNN